MIKKITTLIILTISLFVINPIQTPVEAQSSSYVPGVIVCGDGSYDLITIKTSPSGHTTFLNNGSAYTDGIALARSVQCAFDYKIYELYAYPSVLLCGPNGYYINFPIWMVELESSPDTTVSSTEAWYINGNLYPSLGAYANTIPYSCDTYPHPPPSDS